MIIDDDTRMVVLEGLAKPGGGLQPIICHLQSPTQPIKSPFQDNLATHPITTTYQHTLSTPHRILTYPPIHPPVHPHSLPTHPLHLFYLSRWRHAIDLHGPPSPQRKRPTIQNALQPRTTLFRSIVSSVRSGSKENTLAR